MLRMEANNTILGVQGTYFCVMPICIVLGFGVAYLANGTPSPDNGGLLEEFKMVVLQCRVVTARLSTIVHLVQMTTLLHTLIFVVLESA
jgi:hypothetical protein